MATLAMAAHRHHSEVSSWVLTHMRTATAMALATPKATMDRWLDATSAPQHVAT